MQLIQTKIAEIKKGLNLEGQNDFKKLPKRFSQKSFCVSAKEGDFPAVKFVEKNQRLDIFVR